MLSNLKNSLILHILCVVLGVISISYIGYARSENISNNEVKSTSYCDNYGKALGSLSALNQSGYTPLDLDKLSYVCHAQKSDIDVVLRYLFKYAELQSKRDFPNSMARTPTKNDKSATRNSITSQMKKILIKMKSLPDKSVLQILSYAVKNDSDDYMYSGAALEIVARDYPDHYNNYKRCFSGDPQGLSVWEQIRDQWITEKKPIRKLKRKGDATLFNFYAKGLCTSNSTDPNDEIPPNAAASCTFPAGTKP